MTSPSLGLIGLDRFVLTEHPTATANRYEIRAVDDDGADGPVLAAAQQPRQSSPGKVTFFADDTHRHPVFSFARRPQSGVGSAYDVLDAGGRPIGQLRRQNDVDGGGRSAWAVEAEGLRGRAEERVVGLLSRLRAGHSPSLEVVDPDGRAVMSTERRRGATASCVVTVLDSRLDARVAAALVVAFGAARAR